MLSRTVLDDRKAEEKYLSKDLYNKLRILAQLHKPSDDFLKVLSEDMFVKPNPKAFFQVMSYLFQLLDPVEFKKRFYWPLVDKKSETYFRSSTVQYLNDLNEKHNLKWSQLTNYLVIMPGGIRFITFLLEFFDFVVLELTKRKEKELSEFLGPKGKKKYENLNLKNFKKEQEIYIQKCVSYAENIESATKILKKNSEILEKHFKEIAEHMNISVDRLKDPNFLREWEADNWKLFRNESVKSDHQSKLSKSLNDLKQKITDLLSGETEKSFNRERLQESYNMIKTIYPDLSDHELFQENELNYDAVIKAFNFILPIIHKQLHEIEQKDFRKLEFESAEMEVLRNDFVQLNADLTNALRNCQHKTEDEVQSPNRGENNELDSGLKHIFINTPPIKFDIGQARVTKPHLPLLSDYKADQDEFTFANDETLLPEKPAGNKKPFLSTVKKTSRIIDAQTLLRTVTKQSKIKKDDRGKFSTLASKWKEREKVFSTNNETLNNSIKPESVLLSSPPEESKPTINQSHAPGRITHPRRNLNKSLEFEATSKISTSPTGRLECLIKPQNMNLPKILLNNESILEEELKPF